MLDAKWRLVTCVFALTLSILPPCDTFFGISIKREDDSNTCYYDGGRHQCTFFLFCSLIGGSSVGSCPEVCYQHVASHRATKVYKPTSRIVGGNAAEFGEFPWQAHIKITQQQCGGVLLNHHYVVTAAHCVYRAMLQDVVVVLGAYDIHDQRYQLLPAQKFHRPVRYQENVLPICLPPYGWNFQGWRAIITGWGKTDPALSNRYGTRLLQKVEVPIISNKECEMWHHWKGDSGGPLIVYLDGRWTLVGIISAGFGCAQWRQPGIYHSVSSTVDWISNHIR
ncbi:plasma kallikrein [Caerostris extrusa]|uniref:Plasma kallikrein n=1 Tax=Caerostris extrusa TaxID=172846 RepID=A0AAV4M8J1_CAEEX|nr:plasma kallikrein [Caerostris extrusa]